MKLAFGFIVLFFCFFSANAQVASDWGAFMRVLPAKNYAGKKFRIEAAVKVKVIDPTADAELWVRVDRENKKMGFFYNMMDKPIRLNEWKIYSVSGKIDKDAEYLVFGGLYHRKGIFYFDEFKVFLETENGKFEEVVLPDNGFESADTTTFKSWGYLKDRKGIKINTTEKEFYAGKQSLVVDASAFEAPKTYGSNDSTGKYANVNGIKIYYEEYGTGEPLLLLHGNSSSISLFEKQIPELSKQFRVIAVDTRGQGKSGEDGKTYTYDLFAEDMNALLNYLNLDSVNILGWSDGGNTGLIMAMRYPQKIKRLVTMGANVFIDKTVVEKWVFKELDNQLQKELKEDTTAWGINRRRLITLLLTEPKHSFEELKKIQCPVLVVAGEKDVIKEAHTKAIASNIPNSSLFIAPKETHYFPSENPKAFNAAVIEFLKK